MLCKFDTTKGLYKVANRTIKYDSTSIAAINANNTLYSITVVDNKFTIDNVNNSITDLGVNTNRDDLIKIIMTQYNVCDYIERVAMSQFKRLGDYTQISYAYNAPSRLESIYNSNSNDICGMYDITGNLKDILDGVSPHTEIKDKKTHKPSGINKEFFRRRFLHVSGDNPAFAYAIYNGVNSLYNYQTYKSSPLLSTPDRKGGCIVVIFQDSI